MRTYLTPTQDVSIYQRYPNTNSGLDEILEIGKLIKPLDGSKMYSSGSVRTLINFDIVSGSSYPTSSKYYLKLYLANAHDVNRYQKIEVYPVSRSWTEGSGYFYQDVKNVSDEITWVKANSTTSWSLAGGDFTNTPTASKTLSEFPLQDVKIDVTEIISSVVSGSNTTPWYGLLLKFPDNDEDDSTNLGNIKFFSSNTHTIFSPKLEIVWNDQTFSTGSLKPIPNSNVTILPKNIKEAYTQGEVDKVYFVVRDPYPDKRFDEKQRYRNAYYLPSESYYRIRDQVSGIVIQDFDQYSAISCDTSGSYFVLDTTDMEIDRIYEIDLKIKKDSLVFFPEFNYTFKIDNND